jgi:prevent-host-death family protein
MPISLTEDVKTSAEFEKNPRAMLQQVRRTGRPVVVTVKGKPGAVLVDAETYERKLKAANLTRLLEEAEEQVRNGQTREIGEWAKDFLRGKKASS